jgi:hypothetical protein
VKTWSLRRFKAKKGIVWILTDPDEEEIQASVRHFEKE